MGWVVERHRSGAGALHAREWPDPLVRTVWVLEPVAPALVLGSTQATLLVDRVALLADGVDLVHRRSGGGAVLLVPGECTWVDVLVPRGDPWWDDDVGRSSAWLGAAWVSALRTLGVVGRVHHRPMESGRWGALVCFAGVGPGEVVDGVGAKLVGISQRRQRAGARFQCVVHHRADPVRIVDLLGPAVPVGQRDGLVEALTTSVGTVGADSADVIAALLSALGVVSRDDTVKGA